MTVTQPDSSHYEAAIQAGVDALRPWHGLHDRVLEKDAKIVIDAAIASRAVVLYEEHKEAVDKWAEHHREVERLRIFLYALADDAAGLAETARRWADGDPA